MPSIKSVLSAVQTLNEVVHLKNKKRVIYEDSYGHELANAQRPRAKLAPVGVIVYTADIADELDFAESIELIP